MHKHTAKSEQFFDRSGNESTKPGRTGLDLLGLGAGVEEYMTPLQRREALLVKRASNEERLKRVNAELKPKLNYDLAQAFITRRSELVLEHQEIMKALTLVNAELGRYKSAPNIGEEIIAVCRERCTKPQWQIIMKEAMQRYDKLLKDQNDPHHTRGL